MPSLLPLISIAFPPERWQGMTILLGCSGGADSVALARAICHHRPDTTTVVLAHFNHRLRGEASDQDERFVGELASQLRVSFVRGAEEEDVGRSGDQGEPAEAMPEANGGRPGPRDEASLRERRYRFLIDQCHRLGARYLLTAHTSDDQAETILFQLLRGSGMRGLCGISPAREAYPGADLILVRPMLTVTRRQVIDYLASIQQPYRHDSSNDSLDYSRNWIRHELMPIIEQRIGSEVRSSIARAGESNREWLEWTEGLADDWISRNVRTGGGTIWLNAFAAKSTAWPLTHVVLTKLWDKQGWGRQSMTAEHWRRIREFIEASISGDVLSKPLPNALQLWHHSKDICIGHRENT